MRKIDQDEAQSSNVLPDATDPADLGVLEASMLMRQGKLSVRERLQATLRRIEQLEPQLNAFVRCYPALAEQLADEAQRRIATDPPGSPMCGQPVGLKDWYKVGGLPLEAGSAVWNGYIADVDSTAWERLRNHGAVLVGHTHTFEPVTAPPTRNPWNTECNPGGSSAGSAVAVATGMLPVALGTETTQSLRQPAALCGISTIMPSAGRLSLHGILKFIHTYDHPGVLGRSVQDCSLAFEALLGVDLNDELTLGRAPLAGLPTMVEPKDRPYAGMRIGVPHGVGRPDPGIEAVWTRACRELEALGAELVPLEAELFADDYAAPFEGEILHEHRRLGFYPDRVAEYGPGFRAFLERIAARNITLDDYISACRERGSRMRRWAQLFSNERLAAVFMPSCEFEAGPFSRSQLDPRFVRWSSLCGLPAVGFPGGLSPVTAMPVGLQFVGAFDDDARIIELALHYQMHHAYHKARPPLLEAAMTVV